jgi:hypothetical protein
MWWEWAQTLPLQPLAREEGLNSASEQVPGLLLAQGNLLRGRVD